MAPAYHINYSTAQDRKLGTASSRELPWLRSTRWCSSHARISSSDDNDYNYEYNNDYDDDEEDDGLYEWLTDATCL